MERRRRRDAGTENLYAQDRHVRRNGSVRRRRRRVVRHPVQALGGRRFGACGLDDACGRACRSRRVRGRRAGACAGHDLPLCAPRGKRRGRPDGHRHRLVHDAGRSDGRVVGRLRRRGLRASFVRLRRRGRTGLADGRLDKVQHPLQGLAGRRGGAGRLDDACAEPRPRQFLQRDCFGP